MRYGGTGRAESVLPCAVGEDGGMPCRMLRKHKEIRNCEKPQRKGEKR